ncbi:unnamed protein product, partial [Brassica oleracea var. botrytis]
MIRDLEEFLAFPWGRVAFEMLVTGIKKKDEILLSQTSVALPGFLDAIQLEEDEAVIQPATPAAAVRYCVNPAHVKALDEDEKTEVISFFEDTSHSSDDLTWDDEVVDVVVDEL